MTYRTDQDQYDDADANIKAKLDKAQVLIRNVRNSLRASGYLGTDYQVAHALARIIIEAEEAGGQGEVN